MHLDGGRSPRRCRCSREIVIDDSTVVLSGIVTSVPLVPVQPGGAFTVRLKLVLCVADDPVPVSVIA